MTRGRITTIVCICLAAGVLAPMTAQGQSPGGPFRALEDSGPPEGRGNSKKCWVYKDHEHGFARKINAERLGVGVTELKLDRELSKVARRHTREMWKADLLHHTPSDKLRRRVTDWTILGENVGVGGTVESLHEAFMNSPGHKDNILFRAFRHVGIGVQEKRGRMWVTVIFESAENPGTPLPMPTC